MKLKKLVRCYKDLNVTKIIDHSVSDIVQMSINRRVEVGLLWNIRLNGIKELQDPLSSLERLEVAERILEELF